MASNMEALYAATYVQDFMDAVEMMPNELQRHLSRIRSLDTHLLATFRSISKLREKAFGAGVVDVTSTQGSSDDSSAQSSADTNAEMPTEAQQVHAVQQLKQLLLQYQHIQDCKLEQLDQMTDLVASKAVQLKHDLKCLGTELVHDNSLAPGGSKAADDGATPRRGNTDCDPSGMKGERMGLPPRRSMMSQPPRADRNHLAELAGIVMSVVSGNGNNGSSAANRSPQSPNRQKRTRRQKTFPDYVVQDAELSDPTVKREADAAAPVRVPLKKSCSDVKDKDVAPKEIANVKDQKLDSKDLKRRSSKRRKTNGDGPDGPGFSIPVDPDPNEPTYCLCKQISYGEMIACDNDDCLLQWFHFSCVGLTTKPKGKWYCPQCRGDKPSMMKKDK